MIDSRLVYVLQHADPGPGPIVYWCVREHRLRDNPGLLHAAAIATEQARPLIFLCCPDAVNPQGTLRQYMFLLRSLRLTARDAAQLNIPFVLRPGDPGEEALRLFQSLLQGPGLGGIITDFIPLRRQQGWIHEVSEKITAPMWEVDGRNAVPARYISDKREYAARTIRPKLHRSIAEFLEPFPELQQHAYAPDAELKQVLCEPDREKAERVFQGDRSVGEVPTIKPGEAAAAEALAAFATQRLPGYAAGRNDPNKDMQSGLSPYLHFGMISVRRIILDILATVAADATSPPATAGDVNVEAFLEELIVRRDLSDNYCLHTPEYDRVVGFPDWARKTLDKHRDDPRPYLYETAELEQARTHDPLWNAAQTEAVLTGIMPGYLRMYWAKKILEWSPSPEEALARTVYLNDKYFLDGCDSNGYTGTAWSIGGLHDRPWKERPVFGTIRFMSLNGARSKINVQAYTERVDALRHAGGA